MTESLLKKCSSCLLPQTHETIFFDRDGVCSVCTNSQKKQEIDWAEREAELHAIVKDIKSLERDYDCIIPFSGGKDSTFSLYYAVKQLQLRPLVASFDHGFYRDTLLENRNRTLKLLGVDFISFTPNWMLVKDLMLTSLRDRGDFCWHCHTGVNAFPVKVAVEKNIPLVIWGESSTEYTNYYKTEQFHEIDEELFNRITNLGISSEDMLPRLQGYYDRRSLKPFMFPPQREIKAKGIRSFPLGNYIKWDTKKQVETIKKELGWMGASVEGVPPGYEYEKIECMMQGMRDYLKLRKRGYARTTHLTSIDIRHGRIERNVAAALVDEYENRKPYSVELFLELLGITENELEEIIEQNQIDPWDGKAPIKIGPKPRDYEAWVSKLIVN